MSKFKRNVSCNLTAFWSIESNTERTNWSLCFLFDGYFFLAFNVFISLKVERWKETRRVATPKPTGRTSWMDFCHCWKLLKKNGSRSLILRNLRENLMFTTTQWPQKLTNLAPVEALWPVQHSNYWNKLTHIDHHRRYWLNFSFPF